MNMILDNAIERVLTGNCLLFTGSGFGFGAKNIEGNNLLLGGGLANLLYNNCGVIDHDYDLKSASELFLEEYGEHALIDILKRQFTVKSINKSHELIGKLPWKRVYTTNYDNILELSYHQAGKLLTPITLAENINQYKDFRKLCVHLNGYIESVNPASLNKGFKLTNSSYLTTEFVSSEWVDLFRSDIHTCDALIFIGFSTSSDLDISRIIAEKISHIKEKCFFIVSPEEKDLNIKRLAKFGSVVPIGLEGFTEKVSEISSTYEPAQEIAYLYKSFREKTSPENVPQVRDTHFHNLVLLGNINWDMVYQSVIDPVRFPYFIYREETERVFEQIKSGQTDFLVHSGLGNGKTCFINGIAASGLQKGFKVFMFHKYYDITVNEIEKICLSTERNIVIIENYSNHFDIIEKFNLFRKSNTTLMFTERTIINDTLYYELDDIIGETYAVINLNQLHYQEASQLSKYLSDYGLWGKHSNLSNDVKTRKITTDFNSSIRLTLLDILKSPDILDRLTNLIEPFKDNKPYYHAGLLIIASNILGFSMTLEDLVYLLDDELLNKPGFYNNSQLKEIIDFGANRININSAIVAEGILHTNKYHHDLIPLLVKVTKRLDTSRWNKNHHIILKSIISHSRLQRLFNTHEHNDFRKLVIQFFEEVKTLNYSRTNPHFWLQYAIARLEIRSYKIADQHFDTAYALAKKMQNFDTYQIDNHYARHLLENEIYNGTLESCMPQFLKVHRILNNKHDNNINRHFPFKVARKYSQFYDHYYTKLDDQDKKIFLVSCQEILYRIDEYNSSVDEKSRNKVVVQCFETLSSILFKESKLLRQ